MHYHYYQYARPQLLDGSRCDVNVALTAANKLANVCVRRKNEQVIRGSAMGDQRCIGGAPKRGAWRGVAT